MILYVSESVSFFPYGKYNSVTKYLSKYLNGLSVHITQIWVESVFRFSVAEFSPASLLSHKVVDTKYVMRKLKSSC